MEYFIYEKIVNYLYNKLIFNHFARIIKIVIIVRIKINILIIEKRNS